MQRKDTHRPSEPTAANLPACGRCGRETTTRNSGAPDLTAVGVKNVVSSPPNYTDGSHTHQLHQGATQNGFRAKHEHRIHSGCFGCLIRTAARINSVDATPPTWKFCVTVRPCAFSWLSISFCSDISILANFSDIRDIDRIARFAGRAAALDRREVDISGPLFGGGLDGAAECGTGPRLAPQSSLDPINDANWQFIRPLTDRLWRDADSISSGDRGTTEEFYGLSFFHTQMLARLHLLFKPAYIVQK